MTLEQTVNEIDRRQWMKLEERKTETFERDLHSGMDGLRLAKKKTSNPIKTSEAYVFMILYLNIRIFYRTYYIAY